MTQIHMIRRILLLLPAACTAPQILLHMEHETPEEFGEPNLAVCLLGDPTRNLRAGSIRDLR